MKISTLKNIGIFSTALFATASAVYIYSPVIGSHADENARMEVSTTVEPVAAVTLDSSELNFNITPTSAGVFESKPITATVNTNSTGGYQLYVATEGSDTDMTSLTSSGVIASDFYRATSETMESNKWGFSLDNTTFYSLSPSDEPLPVNYIDHYPSAAERNTTIYFGMKINTSLPSGVYSKNVVFSVLANETPQPNVNRLVDLTSMQDSHLAQYCSETYRPDRTTTATTTDKYFYGEKVPTATIIDNRDGNYYTIAKLADGKCWMTESLRIADETISSDDSNLPSGTTWTIPASSTSGFSAENQNNVYIDNEYGGYYTFYAATAGWGTDTSSLSSTGDICPKGWRLPAGGGKSLDIPSLTGQYNTSTSIQGAPGFKLSGYMSNGTLNNAGVSADYWTSWSGSNSGPTDYANTLNFSNSVNPGLRESYKYYGLPIHCVAK